MQLFRFLALLLFSLHSARAEDALTRRQWTVNGISREALLSIPENAKTSAAPVVFAFHGHGGNMNNAARMYRIHMLWPDAIVVYPQGLNTPGRLTDPEGKKPGWQGRIGDQEDRDLKFFDAMLASLEGDFKVDTKRVYSTGHSNGGGFSYLLLAARGEKLAAIAPSAAAAMRSRELLKPKPVLHIAGENDPLVKFAWQKDTIEAIRKINQCGDGVSWESIAGCTIYPSKIEAPLVTFIHSGNHSYPAGAPERIVKFFKQHARP